MKFKDIKNKIITGRYSIKSHAVRHMIEEGFNEDNCLEAIQNGKILEEYTEEQRCLIRGNFHFTSNVLCPLHIIVDYFDEECIDIITAYIPQRPWWETPSRRGRFK